MNFELQTLDLAQAGLEKCDAMLLLVPARVPQDKSALAKVLAQVRQHGDLAKEVGSLLDIHRPAGMHCRRLILIQMGDASDPGKLRKAVAAAYQLVKPAKPEQLTLYFVEPPSRQLLMGALTSLAEASYVYTRTLSKKEGRSLTLLKVGVPSRAEHAADFDQAVATVQAIELAKEWGNRPPNHATPSDLADAAKALAKAPHLRCKVLGPRDVEKLGMGAFMAVAQGSHQPLQFIELHYNGAPKSQAPVVLVGKGITFDSGGISIKPAAGMDEMKFDMCGAASVLGVFHALAKLQPRLNVVGLIPACENLPSSRAVKPGDVVTSMSGQTIEILNTDAEGRLILCDALSYAERFKPRAVLDIATLTGACAVALGKVRSGFFCNDDDLTGLMRQASEASQDLIWPMPLDEDYADALKTKFADVANAGAREGGAISAAKFLQRFTKNYVWGHLDIAGTAWKSGEAKGATGRPVALLLAYLLALPGKA